MTICAGKRVIRLCRRLDARERRDLLAQWYRSLPWHKMFWESIKISTVEALGCLCPTSVALAAKANLFEAKAQIKADQEQTLDLIKSALKRFHIDWQIYKNPGDGYKLRGVFEFKSTTLDVPQEPKVEFMEEEIKPKNMLIPEVYVPGRVFSVESRKFLPTNKKDFVRAIANLSEELYASLDLDVKCYIQEILAGTLILPNEGLERLQKLGRLYEDPTEEMLFKTCQVYF